MYKVNYHGFYDWVSCGLGAASLALFMYSLSVDALRPAYVFLSTHLFLAAIPLFISNCMLVREVKERDKTTPKADLTIFFLFVLGAALFTVGLLSLSAAVSYTLCLALGVAAMVAVALQITAFRSIKGP